MIHDCELPDTSFFQALILALILIVMSGAGPVFAAASPPANKASDPVASRYQEAKDYYYLLVRDKKEQSKRQNWQNGIRDFRHIYLSAPKGKLAPNCLFMMAKMYYRMYLHFHKGKDLDESMAYYNNVWTLFPDNSLADDALFWNAEIYLKDKNKPAQAARLYSAQITRFPDGDMYAQAVSRLRELDAKHDTNLPGKPGVGKIDNLVNVLPVKYWSSDDYVRIVIRSSAPVRYTSDLLAKQNKQPRRLTIDFSQSAIAEKYTAPVQIDTGLLRQIHSTQSDPDTVRVSLDLEAISSYKIFSLNDPFRVIVDVNGPRKVIAASKTLPLVRQEQISNSRHQEPSAYSTPNLEPAGKKAVRKTHTGKGHAPEDTFIVLDEVNKKEPAAAARKEEGKKEISELSLAQQLGLGVRRIVIDPGHGGKDPGAMGFNLREKDITLQVARKTAAVLQRRYNYEVIMTRDRDTTIPLEERTAIANTTKADLFISIHVNAHPKKSARGVETFFLNLATNTEAMRVAAMENSTSTHNMSDLQNILSDLMKNSKIQESSILADYVQSRMISGLRENDYPTRDLGVKQAPFYVLIGAEMPAVLAEISFISNPNESKRLRQERYLNKIADQIAAGVAGYVEHQATAALQL